MFNVSASITLINPDSFTPQTFDSLDSNIIPSFIISNSFNPVSDQVEVSVYDSSKILLHQDNFYKGWNVENEKIFVDPLKDLINYNFDSGDLNIVYNFVSSRLSSSISETYYIDEISSNRTELRLKSNVISNENIENSYNELIEENKENSYFDETYLNLGNNNYYIITNVLLEKKDQNEILIKLYEPLPTQFELKNEVYIVKKTSEPVAYNVKFIQSTESIDKIIKIKGPNVNLDTNNKIGTSDVYQNYTNLTTTDITSSFYQLKNVLDKKGVYLSVDYTDFSDFVHFSSLEQRLKNFYYKVSLIESKQNELNLILGISGSTSSSLAVSSSRDILKDQISDIISKFDGYEYYLYYESNSYSWPKSNTSIPYILYSTGSVSASVWFGSNVYGSTYFGGQILSASQYDNSNQDNLIYLIPDYLKDNTDNEPYLLFIKMIGQFYDNIWLYTRGITKKLKADNRLLEGVSKDLVADTLKSLGTTIYSNNFSLYNLYSSFLGLDQSGSYFPPTGSDLITSLIAVNSGSNSYPYSLDDINKEIYKRLYHNLINILKKKGTVQGVRELINIYGVPNTILRISEFGGNDKITTDSNYWYNIFNYAYTKNGSIDYIYIPFTNLTTTADRPKSIVFRFQIPTFFNSTSSAPSQSILQRGIAGGGSYLGFGLFMEYNGSGLISGSYSGSAKDPYYQYATVKFIMSGSGGTFPSASVYLPVLDGNWWSVMINKNSDNISLHVKSKNNIGNDGNIVGFQASSSILTNDTGGWNGLTTSGLIRLGRGDITFAGKVWEDFSGSFQEFRYYNTPLSEKAFDSFVLNPLSIEGNSPTGSGSSYNILNFRAPLGADLNTIFGTSSLSNEPNGFSIHPSITGSNPTNSFTANGALWSASEYQFPISGSTGYYFKPNVEYILVREANTGIKSRSSNKIQFGDNFIPYYQENPYNITVLSNQRSIQQDFTFSGSYSENIDQIEIGFSPQDELDDDIIDQLGEFNIGEYIGHPADISASLTYYPSLVNLNKEYFKKYIHNYRTWDYIRLIKFFDNSLFKILKEFIPTKTSLLSGLIIKQHLLERNRYPRPRVNLTSSIAYIGTGSSLYNNEYRLEDLLLTGSIRSIPGLLNGQKTYSSSNNYTSNPLETFIGGTGGMMPNLLNETQSYNTYISQSWRGYNSTVTGNISYTHSSQDEFFNGEFSGSEFIATTQSLNPDCAIYLKANDVDIYYNVTLFRSSNYPFTDFLVENVAPGNGELYILYDTGSNFEPFPTYLTLH